MPGPTQVAETLQMMGIDDVPFLGTRRSEAIRVALEPARPLGPSLRSMRETLRCSGAELSGWLAGYQHPQPLIHWRKCSQGLKDASVPRDWPQIHDDGLPSPGRSPGTRGPGTKASSCSMEVQVLTGQRAPPATPWQTHPGCLGR